MMSTQYYQNDYVQPVPVHPGPRGRGQAATAAFQRKTGVFESDVLKELEQTTNHDAIVTEAPREQSRLSFVDAACLVINRMIGTGVYNSPGTVMHATGSAGGAILLWLLGIICSLAGAHVYIEYGLNVPRFVIDGIEQAVPRSGGDLHYLSYVYNWPYYAKGTVLYVAVLYGISFICVGNMAGNGINFGIRVLQAARPDIEPSHGQVCAIATAVGLFSCAIHAVSRRGGILLNDFLAIVKVCILLIIPCATFAVLAQAVKDPNGKPVPNVFQKNMSPSVAFAPPEDSTIKEGGVAGYSAAFLSILFAFGGIEQSNHVLGEIRTPRRTFPRALTFAVALVGVLYMVVNLSYMAVVPAEDQAGNDVALLFFKKVFSRSADDRLPARIFNSFLALSSFGNIIVTTYTAARMKQEIAKQGFIPYSRFFAQNTDVSIGRLVLHLRKKGWKVPFLASPEEHQEPTPVGAMVLHLGACLVLIWSTFRVRPIDAYGLLTNLTAYLITAVFGILLALGILILRIRGPPATEAAKTEKYRAARPGTAAWDQPIRRTWRDMTGNSVYTWLSIPTATIYLLALAFPVIASWFPITADYGRTAVAWFVVPTICWAIVGLASIWWLGFLAVGRYRQRHHHKTLVHEVWPEFDWAEPARAARGRDEESRSEKRQRDGGKVLVHETVLFTWEVNEMRILVSDEAQGQNTMVEEPVGEAIPSGSMGPASRRRQGPEHQTMPENDVVHTGFENFGTPTWNDQRTAKNNDVPW